MAETAWEQLAHYRQIKLLPDGVRVLLRPLCKDDGKKLADMFARAIAEDLERFRSDPPDQEVIEDWVGKLDLSRVFPLVAEVNEQLIGEATLHFGAKFQRHIAWMRVFLDRDYRRRGIGTLLIQGLMGVAQRVGLHQIHALVPTDQPHVIKALQHLGFRNEFVHRDYAILHDGRTLDVAELVAYLVEHSGEF